MATMELKEREKIPGGGETAEKEDEQEALIKGELCRFLSEYVSDGGFGRDFGAMKPRDRVYIYVRLLPYLLTAYKAGRMTVVEGAVSLLNLSQFNLSASMVQKTAGSPGAPAK